MNFTARLSLPVALLGFPSFLALAQSPPPTVPVTAALPQATRPVMVPDARVLSLDDLGLYQLSIVRRGGNEQFFPVGWTGYFDDETGVACLPTAEQEGRRSWLLHPPWMGGATGLARQSFTFAMPRAKHIELKGAFAMRVANTEGSDGVTFRVKVEGETLVEEHTKETQWHDFSFDLTRYAGRTVTIAFESDAGPQNNSSFDFALWGGRQLVFDGFNPAPVSHPAPIALPLAALTAKHTNELGAIPPDTYHVQSVVSVTAQKATLSYSGADGTMAYTWQVPHSDADPSMGMLSLSARMKTVGGQMTAPVNLPLARDGHIRWLDGSDLKWQSSHFEHSKLGLLLVSRYEGQGQVTTVRFKARLVGKSFVCDVTCDRPVVRSFASGGWGPVMRRRPIPMPYYTSSGNIYFLNKENLFVNAFNDWTASSATALESGRAVYNALTDGHYNLLRERAIFAPAWHLDEVLPTIPNLPSPYLREVGGKVVLDTWWGSNFSDIARTLGQFHDYGLRDLVVIIHVWQRDGYDNGLPAHYPANAGQGGEAAMTELVHTATKLGYRIALHENYVDYYPNYEGFKESDISLKSDGTKQTAWYNEGTKIQSFAVKPTAILPLARSQSPEIHRRYGTNANYLDVHSSVPPWFHVDARAGEVGAGKFSTVFDAHRDLWAFERQTHGGPTFGEGNNHWFWSGLLDGAEAQVDNGWNTPLLVNFDLLKVHPLESNHGMGYYERWWDAPKWSGLPPMQVLDRYRMQTIAFGHAGFLGAPTWNDLRLAWLEHNLVTPVTSHYATARPAEISYQVNGQWLDDSAVARAGASPTRLRVRYDNGLTLVANNDPAPMIVEDVTLPRYGWRADGAGVTAYSATRDGVTVDFAQTPTSTFANARDSKTWNLGMAARTRVAVTDFAQTGPRRFHLNYQWTIGDHFEADYRVFVHFTQPDSGLPDGIAFQGDHIPAAPTMQWKEGNVVNDGPQEVRLPDNLKDGDYEIAAGLYNDKGRRPLAGDMDSNGRARLGTIRVSNGGAEISFIAPVDQSGERGRLYEAGLNRHSKVVDFGSVRTNGSVMIRREGTEWVLQTLPRDGKFVVELDGARFGHPKSVQTGAAPAPITATTGKFWRLPLSGARDYRWRATLK